MSTEPRTLASTEPRTLASTDRLLGTLLVLLAGHSVVSFLVAAAARLRYPYELEWLESETLQHVTRVLAGKPLFAMPTAEFAPTIYPPLYAWLSALVAQLTGVSFLAPRLVSLLATLAGAALAGQAAYRLGGSRRFGLSAFALLLAAYFPCGTVFDLARLDPLWVSFLLAATALAARAEATARPGAAVLAGTFLALATATKQPAVLLALGLAVALWRRSRGGSITLLLTWATLTTGYYGALHLVTGGWSTFYLAEVPLRVAHQPSSFVHLVRDDLLASFAPAVALLALWLLAPREALPGGSISAVWWTGLLAAVAMTASTRTLQGGWLNGLLPAAAFGATLVGAVAGRVWTLGTTLARRALLVALVLQFALLLHSPRPLVPTPADRRRAEAFIARLAEIPGEVWVPAHTSYAHLAGKPFLVHRDPLLDLFYSKAGVFPEDLLEKLGTGAFAAVVLDGTFAEERIQQALDRGYALELRLDDAPAPLAGYRTSPALLYRPRSLRP